MYEVARTHAPNSSKAVGVAMTVMMTVAVGYALANGFGEQIARMMPDPITFTTIEETQKEPPPPPQELEVDTRLPETKVLVSFDNPFVIEDPVVITAPRAPDGPVAPSSSGGGGTVASVPVPAMKRVSPKLLPTAKPPYPASEVRAEHQGTTTIVVCVDPRGRVTSADVAASSGYPKLDDASVKWVKSARFSPGTLDGAPQSVCGHKVVYEWNLESARK